MRRRKLWINARTWDEIEATLNNHGMPHLEVLGWICNRRSALRELFNRLNGGCRGFAIVDADHWHISGQDCLGEWSYSPTNGLQPIDYYELRSTLVDFPIELDLVCRGILKNRLVCDGHHPDLADSALDRLSWCCDSKEQSFAPNVEEAGWDKYARALAGLIDKERGERASMRQQQINMEQAEAAELIAAQYASPVDIAREARLQGFDINYRTLCKVRNLPDNGAKGKNRRKLLKSAAMEWIKRNCSRVPSSNNIGAVSQVLLNRIVRYLKKVGTAMVPAIAFAVKCDRTAVANLVMSNPTLFVSSPDGWSLK